MDSLDDAKTESRKIEPAKNKETKQKDIDFAVGNKQNKLKDWVS